LKYVEGEPGAFIWETQTMRQFHDYGAGEQYGEDIYPLRLARKLAREKRRRGSERKHHRKNDRHTGDRYE